MLPPFLSLLDVHVALTPTKKRAWLEQAEVAKALLEEVYSLRFDNDFELVYGLLCAALETSLQDQVYWPRSTEECPVECDGVIKQRLPKNFLRLLWLIFESRTDDKEPTTAKFRKVVEDVLEQLRSVRLFPSKFRDHLRFGVMHGWSPEENTEDAMWAAFFNRDPLNWAVFKKVREAVFPDFNTTEGRRRMKEGEFPNVDLNRPYSTLWVLGHHRDLSSTSPAALGHVPLQEGPGGPSVSPKQATPVREGDFVKADDLNVVEVSQRDVIEEPPSSVDEDEEWEDPANLRVEPVETDPENVIKRLKKVKPHPDASSSECLYVTDSASSSSFEPLSPEDPVAVGYEPPYSSKKVEHESGVGMDTEEVDGSPGGSAAKEDGLGAQSRNVGGDMNESGAVELMRSFTEESGLGDRARELTMADDCIDFDEVIKCSWAIIMALMNFGFFQDGDDVLSLLPVGKLDNVLTVFIPKGHNDLRMVEVLLVLENCWARDPGVHVSQMLCAVIDEKLLPLMSFSLEGVVHPAHPLLGIPHTLAKLMWMSFK